MNSKRKAKKIVATLREETENVRRNPSPSNYARAEREIENAGKNSNETMYIILGIIVFLLIGGFIFFTISSGEKEDSIVVAPKTIIVAQTSKPASVSQPRPTSTSKPKPTSTSKPKPTSTSKPKPTSTSKPRPTSISQVRNSANITCNGAPPTRLNVSYRARVTYTDGTPGSVRSAPASGQIYGKVPEGVGMDIIGGPKCDNSRIWWKVKTDNGYTGWMSEGKLGEYWLELTN